MSTAILSRPTSAFDVRENALEILAPIGRVLFSLIFIAASLGHFASKTISYAASQGVPLASLLVPLSGIIALAGGLSIALGYKTRWGAGLIVLFLIPVTLMMHRFWGLSDPMMAEIQQVNFMKNVGLLGGALLILHFGAGPMSLDNRR
jgi:putative oxidoreductase